MENTEKPISEIAQERFGDEYTPSDDRLESPEEIRGESLSLDEAYDRLQTAKDDVEAPQEDPQETPQKQPVDAGSDAVWSNEDVTVLNALQSEAQSFKQDLASLAQAKAQDIDKLSEGDKSKAAAIRTQISEAEKELRQRYETLQSAAGELQGKAVDRERNRIESTVQQEHAKLQEAMPDIDQQSLRRYLTDTAGFAGKDLDYIMDHRLVVLAEKARRYDEQPRPKRQPKFVKRRKPNGAPSVSQLRSRLHDTGSIDDAFSFLQASRAARSAQ